MKEDNQISKLGDYDAPFCEKQYTDGSCYISLFKFKSASHFGHLLSCGTIVSKETIEKNQNKSEVTRGNVAKQV